MGIESDQLVYDYLSRVGDLAQQRGLPAATRMRLVTGLRAEIDGQQADSVSGVKRVLARLGTPEAVVAAAGSADDRVPGASRGGPSARPGPATG
ncbi:HAAS signaling domain-containing protein, partial [Streptomyces decoyicus]